jgi:hypothetical protein
VDHKFPFTSYDFWAYLASGGFLLAAADLAARTGFLLQEGWTWPQTAIAVAAAYVGGQLTAGLSSFIIERALVGKLLGYPRDTLFGKCIARPWVRKCLSAYFEELPVKTQQAALDKGKALGVDGPGEQLFWPAFTAAKANSKAVERMENFLNLYGFARNIALVAFLDAAVLGWAYHWNGGEPLHGNVAILCVVVGIGMTLRYIKFFRLYAVEVFTTFAYAK